MSNTNLSMNPAELGNANLIYILYLVGLVLGITTIVGVIMAYVSKSGASPVLISHYNNQINVFWKFLLYCFIGGLTAIFLVGFFILVFALVWYIVRVVKGMQALARGDAISRPGSWGF
ncbi:MAG TPA: hypothetical protein DCL54_06015 [Alphaproteobacteria bacterium]|nr:hypothetical protein [Alphaproteobacteria bacterium]HAJ46119.1 hypothetical protein [Alphaproteobacteria bacterium]